MTRIAFLSGGALLLGLALAVPSRGAEDQAVSLGEGVCLRSAPDPAGEAAGRLALGEPVTVVGRSTHTLRLDGVGEHWYEVSTASGTRGWVFGGFLRPSGHEALSEARHMVILEGADGFEDARRRAQAYAEILRTPFSMNGRVYDPERGLIFPDEHLDRMYAGSYLPRRGNVAVLDGRFVPAHVSVERAAAYPELRGQGYVIVAGIYADAGGAGAAVRRYLPAAPNVYAKKVSFYRGRLP